MTQTGVVSWSKTASSNASADSNINWAEGMALSQVNDSARAEMASVAKWRDDNAGSLVTTGSSGAFTVTSNQSFSALTVLDGQTLHLRFKTPNSAAATLAVDGLTAKPLQVDATNALPAGRITTDSIWAVTYDNTAGAFIVHNSGFGSPGMRLLSRQVASASGTIDFASGLSTFYDHYMLKIANCYPASLGDASTAVRPTLRLGTGAGPTYTSSSNAYLWANNIAGTYDAQSVYVSQDTAITISSSGSQMTSTGGAVGLCATVNISVPTSTASPNLYYQATYQTTAGYLENSNGSAATATLTGPITAIRFLFTSGNIASGTFSLYGYAAG